MEPLTKAAQDIKTNRSVKCRLRFLFLHKSKKTRLVYIFQKMLHTGLPANKSRRGALSEFVAWQLLAESIQPLAA